MIKRMVVFDVAGLFFAVVSIVVGISVCGFAQAQDELVYQWFKVTDHATFPTRDGAGGLVFDDKMWILGGWNPPDTVNYPKGTSNDVWNSTDGETWTQVKPNTFIDGVYDPLTDWEGRHTGGYVVHDDKMWIVGGDPIQGHYQDDVWSSSDGVTWTHVNQGNPVPWGPRILHYTTVFDNKIWVMGGQTTPQFAPAPEALYNDVWNSSDGVNWTQVTEHAPWSPRGMIQGSVEFNGRMWLLGGGTYDTPTTGRTFYNEVWSTADGVNWQMDTTAPWDPRQYHSVAVFDNKMWVMAGGNLSTPGFNRNDVWHSEDGVNWTQVPNTPWSTRHAGTAMVYDDALWMVAGSHPGSTPINDVWKLILTEPPPPKTPEMVLSWDMDTLNGSNVADLSGNGNDGAFRVGGGSYTRMETGGPFAASPAYYELDRGGTTTGVQIEGGTDSSLDIQTGDYSVSVWFKIDETGWFGEMASRYEASADGAYYLAYGGDGTVTMAHFSGGAYNYAVTPIVGDLSEWHHAVGVFEEGVGTTVWVDGVAGPTDSNVTAPIGVISDLFVAGGEGHLGSNRYPFDGALDELKLFNYALSEQEILLLLQTNSATPLGGDFDLNGAVDVSDLGVLATNYGISGGMTWADGDANADGNVDVTDLGILATNYGTGTATGAGSVPEPSMGLLIIVGLLTLGLRGRRW